MESPTWQSILKESIVYDHHANSAWLEPILTHGDEESKRVFNHILAASEVWVTRLEGHSLPKMPDMEFIVATLDNLRTRWLAAVDKYAYGDVIDYKNTKGEPASRTFGDITRHAMNHGTYHRGQIRQIFGSRGVEFPDTDFILYSWHRDGE